MQVSVRDLDGKEVKKIELPMQFNEEIREDIVRRGVLSILSNKRQPYGSHIGAGMRYSAKISRRRRDYKGSYGYGISRVPRKILSKTGSRFYWRGAVAPNTVGGRRAHPPKVSKIWKIKVNKKERRKAIRSALAATFNKEFVKKRGHFVPDNYPFVIVNDLENIDKTKVVYSVLRKIGFESELKRGKIKTIRAGKGKRRARKYIKRKSLLIVVSKPCNLMKSARNIPGVDIRNVSILNVNDLAPGTHIGRISLFTEGAIKKIADKKLFI